MLSCPYPCLHSRHQNMKHRFRSTVDIVVTTRILKEFDSPSTKYHKLTTDEHRTMVHSHASTSTAMCLPKPNEVFVSIYGEVMLVVVNKWHFQLVTERHCAMVHSHGSTSTVMRLSKPNEDFFVSSYDEVMHVVNAAIESGRMLPVA